jgi:asparagine synthetase B (glutamine-hydrolysing)
MIGIHIYNKKINYKDNHDNITRTIGEFNITVSYHSKYDKQVFFETETHSVFVDGWVFSADNYFKQAEYVLENYIQDSSNFIYELNGQFNIVVCNKKMSSFVYYTDIFSFRKHYYSLEEDQLLLSSNLIFLKENIKKRTLNIDHIKKNISLPRFIDKSETFIKEIKQVSSCMKIFDNSVLNYSIERVREKFEKKETNPALFLNKIKRKISKIHNNENLLLLLSGGLDSRFLLEIFKDLNISLQTSTYGTEISDEVSISSLVAKCNEVKHFICNLDAKDFILDAKKYINDTQGLDIFVQSSVYKFYAYLKNKVKENSVIDTGFALDVFLGGSYVNDIKKFQNDIKISDLEISNLSDYSTENRVFSSLAIRQSAHREFYEDRYSMFDYEIYFLMKNLPENLIKDNKFYYSLCELQIKNSFHIPLQSTMFDLTLAPKEWKNTEAIQLEKEKYVLDYFNKNNLAIYHNRYYSDFDMWIRADNDWKLLIEKMFLENKSYLAKHFLDQSIIENTIIQHMKGKKSHLRNIVKWVSLELFFKANVF